MITTAKRESWRRAIGPMLEKARRRGDWLIFYALATLWQKYVGRWCR
jgi:hypothetical protein